jgi:exopolyphosphatase/guanosine-5'-triphosphate,3'-diphosphate pyrophosphatase
MTYKELNIPHMYRYELSVAARLCMSGSSMHFYSQNKHSYTLIQDALEFGFTHKQITLIATLAKYAKSKLPPSSHVDKYRDMLPKEQELNALSYLLSLSVALLSHRPKNIDFTLDFQNSELQIVSKNSLYLAKENIKKLDVIENFRINFSS